MNISIFFRLAFVISAMAASVCLVSSMLPYFQAVGYDIRLKAQYDSGHSEYVRENFDRLISGRDAKDRFIAEELDNSPAGQGLRALRESSIHAEEARHRRAVEVLLGALWLAVSAIGAARVLPEGLSLGGHWTEK